MIYYSQEYSNDKGATIIQNHIVEGMPPNDFPLFLGVGAINIPTPVGEVEEKILVPIPATDIKEAFSKFELTMKRDGPEIAKKAVENIRNKIMEMQQKNSSRIITAGQMPEISPFKA